MSLRIRAQSAIPVGDYAAPNDLIPYIEGMSENQFGQFIRGIAVDAAPSTEPVETASNGDHLFTPSDHIRALDDGEHDKITVYFRYNEKTAWKVFGRDTINEALIGYLPSQMSNDLLTLSTSSSSSSSSAPSRVSSDRPAGARGPRVTEAMMRSKHWETTVPMAQSSSGVPAEYAEGMAKINWETLGGVDSYDYIGTDRSAGPSEQRAAMRYIIRTVGSVDDAKAIVAMKQGGRVPADENLRYAVIKVSYKMIEFILPEDSLAKKGRDFMLYIRAIFLAIKAKEVPDFELVEPLIPVFIGGQLVDGKPKSQADQMKARRAFHVNHYRFLQGIFTQDFISKVKFTE